MQPRRSTAFGREESIPYISLEVFRDLLRKFDEKYSSRLDVFFGGWPGVDEFRAYLTAQDSDVKWVNGTDKDLLPLLPILLRAERRVLLKGSPVDKLFQEIKQSLFTTCHINQAFLDRLLALEDVGIPLTSKLLLNLCWRRKSEREMDLLKLGLIHIKKLHPHYDIENIVNDLTSIIFYLMQGGRFPSAPPVVLSDEIIKNLSKACCYQSTDNFKQLVKLLSVQDIRWCNKECIEMLCDKMQEAPGLFYVQVAMLILPDGMFTEVDQDRIDYLIKKYREKHKTWSQVAPFIAAMRANAGNPLAVGMINPIKYTVQQYLYGGLKSDVVSENVEPTLAVSEGQPAKPNSELLLKDLFPHAKGLDVESAVASVKPLSEDEVRQHICDFILNLQSKLNNDEKMSAKPIEIQIIEMLGEITSPNLNELRGRITRAIRATSNINAEYKRVLINLDGELQAINRGQVFICR